MINPVREEKIRYRIGKAERTLLEANDIFRSGYLDAALNRYYYACFYAVTALLLTKNLETKTHAGVRILLNLHFIQTGIIPMELGQFFGQLFEKRQRSDYDDFIEVDEETVANFAILAENFITFLKTIIKNNL
jgi:uncharacterized protein (UPF0332 family)